MIDILPKCVSSVYFFYDPELSFLTLGTYGTLREIDFVRELMQSSGDLKEYYMGFYIHSCPKMRYKGRLDPSALLCPEVYSWHPLTDELRDKLDKSKYSRLNTDPNGRDAELFSEQRDLKAIRLFVECKFISNYGDYSENVRTTFGLYRSPKTNQTNFFSSRLDRNRTKTETT